MTSTHKSSFFHPLIKNQHTSLSFLQEKAMKLVESDEARTSKRRAKRQKKKVSIGHGPFLLLHFSPGEQFADYCCAQGP